MDVVCEVRAGLYIIPWDVILDKEDLDNLEIVEKLRFIDLAGIVQPDNTGLRPEFECAPYNDESLTIPITSSFPLIYRFHFRSKKFKGSWEWYTIRGRGNNILCFTKITTFKSREKCEGFDEKTLWS